MLWVRRFAATLGAAVPSGIVKANIGYLPSLLGENLAGQIDNWVMEHQLGYYPALAFFRDQPAVVDPALLLLSEQVAQFCLDYAEREVHRRLSQAFSSVQVQRGQATCYGLPHIRPSRGGAPGALARHYSPNRVRLDLVLSTLQKSSFEGAERLVRQQLARLLHNGLEEIEIGSVRQAKG